MPVTALEVDQVSTGHLLRSAVASWGMHLPAHGILSNDAPANKVWHFMGKASKVFCCMTCALPLSESQDVELGPPPHPISG